MKQRPSGSTARGQSRLLDELNQVKDVIWREPALQSAGGVGAGTLEVVRVVVATAVEVAVTATFVLLMTGEDVLHSWRRG